MISETIGIFETQRNAKLVARMRDSESDVIAFPLPESHFLKPSEGVLQQLKSVTNFDWLIVTCPISANHFLDVLEGMDIDLFDLDLTKVVAFGETVSDVLRFRQVHSDIVVSPFGYDETGGAISRFEQGLELNGNSLLVIGTAGNVSRVSQQPEINLLDFVRFESVWVEKALFVRQRTMLMNGCCDRFIVETVEELYSLLEIVGAESLEVFLDSTLLTSEEAATSSLIRSLSGRSPSR